MAGDFGEFLSLLARIAQVILDVTLNIICVALLIIAMAVPWRFFGVLIALATSSKPLEDQWSFRLFCLGQIGCSLLDIVAAVTGLCCLLWPPRWSTLCRKLGRDMDPSSEDKMLYYNAKARFAVVECLGQSLLDIPGLCLGIFALVCPFRTLLTLKSFRWEQELRKDDWEAGSWEKNLSAFRKAGYMNGPSALLDAVLFLWALPFCLVVPTRWRSFFRLSFLDRSSGSPDDDDDEDFLNCCCCCQADKTRGYWFLAPWFALFDVLAGAAGLLAILDVLRVRDFRAKLAAAWDKGKGRDFEEADFTWEIRQECFRFGLLALLDILLLPGGLLLLLLVYRSGPLIRAVCPSRLVACWQGSSNEEGLGRCCVPLLRADSLSELEPGTEGRDNSVLPYAHRVLLRQLALTFLDFLVLPLTVLTLVTVYRWPQVLEDVTPVARRGKCCPFHAAVVYNAMVVLHDAVQLPFILLLLVSVYRTRPVWALITRREQSFRSDVWNEVGDLLLDLPCLPVLLVLLVTLWRADFVLHDIKEARHRSDIRRVIFIHFGLLLRDLVGFVAAVIVAGTLIRLPTLLLELWSKRSRVATGEPRVRLRRLSLLLPEDGAQDRRPRLTFEGNQDAPLDRDDIVRVSLNVVSPGFWAEVSRVFGTGLASFGKGFLPLALTDGKQLRFHDLLDSSVRFNLCVGSRSLIPQLMRLEHSVVICIQLELENQAGETEVYLRVPVQLEHFRQAAESPGTAIEVPADFLQPDAVERLCGPVVAGSGVRDAFWLCSLMQLLQLVLDITHLLLWLLTAVAPWRFLQCVRHLWAPEAVWLADVARRAAGLAALREASLSRYRTGLEPALNRSMKTCKGFDHGESLSNLLAKTAEKELSEFALPPSSFEKSLMQKLAGPRPEFTAKLKAHSALQEAAAAYWPSLAFAVSFQKMKGALSPEQHAAALRQIQIAEADALQIASRSLAGVQRAAAELRQQPAGPTDRRGPCGKSLEVQRTIIRDAASLVLGDICILVLLTLLLVTVYRLPLALYEVARRGRQAPLADRLRASGGHQAWLLGCDLWLLVSTLLSSLLALVTVVRALDFLVEATAHCRSLREVRSAGLRCAKEALGSIWELIFLLTFWRTYQCLIWAVVFSLLLPASGFVGLPIAARLVPWAALCVLPWVLPGHLPLILAVTAGALLPSFALHVKSGTGRLGGSDPADGVRSTWLNLFMLLSVPGEAALLVAAADFGPDLVRTRGLLPTATAVVAVWLLMTAFIPALGAKDRANCQSSVAYQAAMQLFRSCLMLPASAILLAAVAAPPAGEAVPGQWEAALLIFLGATAVLGLGRQSDDAPLPELGLDMAQAPLFLAGLAFAQLPLMGAEIFGVPRWAQLILAVLAPCWVFGYGAVVGSFGGPLWLRALRESAACVPLWAQICRAAGLPVSATGAAWWAGLGALAFVAIIRALSISCGMARQQHDLAAESGVTRHLRALARQGQILCQAGDGGDESALHLSAARAMELAAERLEGEPSAWRPPPGPQALALLLVEFEALIRVERLDADFLRRRQDWIRRVREGRGSYRVVTAAAKELQDAVRTPPTSVLVVAALKDSSPAAKRVGAPLWAIIMEFTGGEEPMGTLLKPSLTHFAAGSPARQLRRAQALVADCVQSLALQNAEDAQGVHGALGRWWQRAPGRFGLGCPCGRPQRIQPRCGLLGKCCFPRKDSYCCSFCVGDTDQVTLSSGQRHTESCTSKWNKLGASVMVYRLPSAPEKPAAFVSGDLALFEADSMV